MAKDTEQDHIPHKDRNLAYHINWEFRREAAIWDGDRPRTANLRPIGDNLRKWLLREGQLTTYVHADKDKTNALTNPYSYNASVLAAVYADIINTAHRFIHEKSSENEDWMTIEIRAIRYYSELVLYTARLCEALIKQLLYCTTFKKRDYSRATLGTLLQLDCSGCRNSNAEPHRISLLGSLGHRYGKCGQYEQCLHDKLTIVGSRRNSDTAHAQIVPFEGLEPAKSRERLDGQMLTIGNELIHMLRHIGDIEIAMVEEMHENVDAWNRQANVEGIELLKSLGLIKSRHTD